MGITHPGAAATAAALVIAAVATTPSGAQPTDSRALGEVIRLLQNPAQHPGPLPPPATDEDYYDRNPRKEALGRLLFYDKILSGNMNISCATCHHGLTDMGDGLSLPVGEGGVGLGMPRSTGFGDDAVHERVPRNAPHVFNLGAREFEIMFFDGRVAVNPNAPSGFDSPAGNLLPLGLDNVLAAQAMFPVTSAAEMAGQAGENDIADAGHAGDLPAVWGILAMRLRNTPGYADLFIKAFADISNPSQITYAHAANAIAAWEASAFRADKSPFDRYLRNETDAMSGAQVRGMELFYGAANCVSCHSGTFQTDQNFHAIAMPQIGPGKGHNLPGFEGGLDDLGREAVTGAESDRLKFRTPTLRNVALTGPWGHDGAYNTLERVIRHHLDTAYALEHYDTKQAALPPRPDLNAIDFLCHNDPARRAVLIQHSELGPMSLTDQEVADLMDFMNALTDPGSVDLRFTVPMKVPSGLPVFD